MQTFDSPVPTPAVPPHRAYAADPIGGPIPKPEIPPHPAEIVRAINWYELVNLGSVVDVLM